MHVSAEDVEDMLADSSHGRYPCPYAGCTRSFETEDSLEQHCTDKHNATAMDIELSNQVRHLAGPEEMVLPGMPEYEDLSGVADEDFAPARDRSRDRSRAP